MTVRRITHCALMGAGIAAISPLAVPIGPVPLTFGFLAVLLTATLLPVGDATAAVMLYVSLGAVGLPVFAGAQGGLGVLLGPLGGYLWGYLAVTPPVAFAATRIRKRQVRRPVLFLFTCLILSTILCHLCGNLQYSLVSSTPFFSTLLVTSVPFLLSDVAKCLLAAWLVPRLWRALDRPHG